MEYMFYVDFDTKKNIKQGMPLVKTKTSTFFDIDKKFISMGRIKQDDGDKKFLTLSVHLTTFSDKNIDLLMEDIKKMPNVTGSRVVVSEKTL